MQWQQTLSAIFPKVAGLLHSISGNTCQVSIIMVCPSKSNGGYKSTKPRQFPTTSTAGSRKMRVHTRALLRAVCPHSSSMWISRLGLESIINKVLPGVKPDIQLCVNSKGEAVIIQWLLAEHGCPSLPWLTPRDQWFVPLQVLVCHCKCPSVIKNILFALLWKELLSWLPKDLRDSWESMGHTCQDRLHRFYRIQLQKNLCNTAKDTSYLCQG